VEYRNPNELKPHPISVKLYGDNHIADIIESIREFGILTPLTITSDNKIISGHRRWRSALTLELDTVPVEIKTYENELSEKRGILEFNRQREKTFSQKMNEAKLLKEIVAEENRTKQENKPRNERGQFTHDTDISTVGKTNDFVGRQVDIGGRDTYSKAERIWGKAQEGDFEALELVNKLDSKEITINKAYTDIFDKAHVSHNTGENEWYTPSIYIDAAREVMGTIDLDPASSGIANKTVMATTHYSIQDDGRKMEWKGNVWLNPPYAQPLISQFCDLLIKNYKDDKVQQACVLVNNATETNFYQNMLFFCNAVCFIKGRIKFIDKQGRESGTPLQGQTVLYFGSNRDKFAQYFGKFGVVLYAR